MPSEKNVYGVCCMDGLAVTGKDLIQEQASVQGDLQRLWKKNLHQLIKLEMAGVSCKVCQPSRVT